MSLKKSSYPSIPYTQFLCSEVAIDKGADKEPINFSQEFSIIHNSINDFGE